MFPGQPLVASKMVWMEEKKLRPTSIPNFGYENTTLWYFNIAIENGYLS